MKKRYQPVNSTVYETYLTLQFNIITAFQKRQAKSPESAIPATPFMVYADSVFKEMVNNDVLVFSELPNVYLNEPYWRTYWENLCSEIQEYCDLELNEKYLTLSSK